jgi:hypothetical protein
MCTKPIRPSKPRKVQLPLWVPTILIINKTKLFNEDPKAEYMAIFF